MKLIFILLIVVSVSLPACAFPLTSLDSANRSKILNKARLSKRWEKMIFFIDGKQYDGRSAKRLLPDNDSVVDVQILKVTKAVKQFGPKANNGAVLIFTKGYATKEYLNKLCSLTTGYRTYLVGHEYSDCEVFYDIDGEYVGRDLFKKIRLLYNLPINHIKSTFFTETYMDKGINCTVFSITTKKP